MHLKNNHKNELIVSENKTYKFNILHIKNHIFKNIFFFCCIGYQIAVTFTDPKSINNINKTDRLKVWIVMILSTSLKLI